MLYTIISLFIHHGVWARGGRGPVKKTSVLSWKSQASKKLSTLRRFHTAADSSNEGKRNPGTKSDFSGERGVWKSPSENGWKWRTKKRFRPDTFVCVLHGKASGGGGEEEALETNSQINMIRAISIQHTNGGVVWLCEKDWKEPAGGWLRKKEKTPKKGDGDCEVTFPCTHTRRPRAGV